MFYFSLLNLNKNNSKVKNIFLVACTHAEDLKRYEGMDTILSTIVMEIKQLETEGLSIDSNLYFASIAQIIGDNVGLHQMMRLKEAWLGKNICHLCDATSETIQENISISNFNEKNKEFFENLNFQDSGIKALCPLNKLKNYHIMQNYAFDLTHDLWEGIVQKEIELIIHTFIYKYKFFSLEYINEMLINFKYGIAEKKNRPFPIKKVNSEKKIKLKQEASKMLYFFRILPNLIGKKVPKENKLWEIYLTLSEIIDILYLDRISFSNLNILENLIEKHHLLYKSELKANLTKKHHNLTHYPDCIKKIGNLKYFQTIRYESKHKFIKKYAVSTNNCINIPLSVTKKNQIRLAYEIESGLIDEKIILVGNEIELSKVLEEDSIKEYINQLGPEKSFYKKVKFYGQLYSRNYLLAINRAENQKIEIVEIILIVKIGNNLRFLCDLYEIKTFNRHNFFYEIIKTNKKIYVDEWEIYHTHPFDKYYLEKRDNVNFFSARPYSSINL